MLGTFPKGFSQAATSQGYFPKWQLPKCAICQVQISLTNLLTATALGPLAHPSHSAQPPIVACGTSDA